MTDSTATRLFGYDHAFAHPVTVTLAVAVAILVIATPIVIVILARAGRVGEAQREELFKRYYSWLVLIPAMTVPVLLGAAWTIGAVAVLSLMCYREFARATGLFRAKLVSLTVTLGILAVSFATADHWYSFFMALFPLSVAAISAVAILSDQPEGYIQRVGLGVLAFSLFGSAMGHLGYFANDAGFRPMLLMLLVCVELNDVFAYCVGKPLGKRKLAPNTSPNKTIAGAVGALVLTTLLVVTLGSSVFRGTVLSRPGLLVGLGLIISIAGQLGDLMLSSIKRDLGIKDMGVTLPGHGGLLDRFDSLILVAPAAFHYIGYFLGIGLDQDVRIITGG